MNFLSDNYKSIDEQQRIEEEATLNGIRRFDRTLQKAKDKNREATSPVGSAMVKRIIEPMEILLRDDFEKRARGRASGGGPLLKPLRDIDPSILCLVATRAALQRMSRPTKLTALARRIGEALEDEMRWHRWKTYNKRQADAVRKRVDQSTSPQQRRAALSGFAKRWEKRAVAEAWSPYHLIALGTRFVDYLVSLGVFEMTKIGVRVPGKKRQAAHAVELTAQAAEWAKEMADFLAVSRPLSWPLVIPPVPWTSTSGGGFHFRDGIAHPSAPLPLRPLPLVRHACPEQKEMLAKADLSTVYAGLNAAQATAWRINPRIYAVLTAMLDAGARGAGLASLDQLPIPARLSDEEVKDKERFLAHKNEIRTVKTANAAMFSKRIAQHRVYSVAKRFVIYPAIYFAHNMDFRGRVYACSDDLSPQGNDLQRGLLEFAEGDKLTEDGADWLCIHLANTYGEDKVSFAARLRWAADHLPMILAVAADPLGCTEWHKADQPWQFLAACFAYEDFNEKRYDSVCRVPVMLDGSCSGIQHYAALLHDEVAGAAVNLIPGDAPSDLYRDVSDEVMKLLRASTDQYALGWLRWSIDRKIVKRSVMVLPYGGTFLSNLDYVREAVRDRVKKAGTPGWLTEENEQDAYVALAKIVWAAMHEVVKGPIEGMKYVRRLVKAWAKAAPRKKMYWISPCGLPVVPSYQQMSGKLNVTSTIGGRPVSLSYRNPTTKPNWGRVGQGAAPNFVHSLDASHLLKSLKRASVEGIAQIAVVHDAFGTTPTKTAQFAQVLRDEFSRMYQEDPFDAVRASLASVGGELPAAPVEGSLVIASIAASTYLFA